MRSKLRKCFVPHEENNFAPHLLRGTTVLTLAFIGVLAFGIAVLQTRSLIADRDFLAAVVPDILVDLTNESRDDNALPPLAESGLLKEAAERKANDMAEKGYFAHTSPEGLTPWHWFIETGYTFSAAGENLAVNFTDSGDVSEAWLDSPGHRANILNDVFTEIGIATAKGEYQGRETVFVVELFGRPASQPLYANAAGLDTSPAEAEVAPETPIIPEMPEVASAEDTPTADTEDFEVVAEDDVFIAIVGAGREPEAVVVESEITEGVLTIPESRVSLFDRLFSKPRQALSFVYAIIAALVTIALIFAVVVEVERQHPKHVLYGVLLLVLLGALFYVNHAYLFGELLVV